MSGGLAVAAATFLLTNVPSDRPDAAPVAGRAHSAPAHLSAPARKALPPGLREAVSATIGASQAPFQTQTIVTAVKASADGLASTFTSSSVDVATNGGSVSFQVLGLGPEARPVAKRNRVTYRRGAVTEWYVNGPLGLEQGFTFARRPHRGPLSVTQRLSGDLLPRQLGQMIVFGDREGMLRYSGLRAYDAAGRSLPARMKLTGRTLVLSVDDTNARYPVTIDPFIQQAAKLSPSDGGAGAGFGTSVALSSDGGTALVGAPQFVSGDQDVGRAWIFTRGEDGAWTQTQTLNPDSGSEVGAGRFGASVALSWTGSTALIGGPRDNGDLGAAWVFTNDGSSWKQETKLTASVAVNDPDREVGLAQLGSSVALSWDGGTALVGGPADSGQGNLAGAAWVFTRSSSTWSAGKKLLPNNETGGGRFGNSVSLSWDGGTSLIGGPNNASNAGAAWVFSFANSTWTQSATLTPSDQTSDDMNFGFSVSLAWSNDTALIGGPGIDGGRIGAAWVFSHNSDGWHQAAKITPPADAVGAPEFGSSVAYAIDGTNIVIGAPGDKEGVGAAWTFVPTDGLCCWASESKLVGADEGGAARFGTSVALSQYGGIVYGGTVLVGGPADTTQSTQGAAWPFIAPVGPFNEFKLAGQTATFKADIAGSPALTVQWQVSTNGGDTFTDVSGATSTTLTFKAALDDDGNRYRAVITRTNPSGTITTSAATLTIDGIEVNTFADALPAAGECQGKTEDCSLRQAIDAARNNDLIELPPGTYKLSVPSTDPSQKGGALKLGAKSLTIRGAFVNDATTAADVVITRDYAHGFDDSLISYRDDSNSAFTELLNLSLNGGDAGGGGAIQKQSGFLEVHEAILNGNTGGAITNAGGALALSHTTFSNNTGTAIRVTGGDLHLFSSRIVSNHGLGIDNQGASVDLDNDTFDSNNVGDQGAALRSSGATATVTGSSITVSRNTATGVNGALLVAGGTLDLTNSTIADNASSSGIRNIGGTVTLEGVTIDGNFASLDTEGPGVTTSIHNTIVGAPGCSGTVATGTFNIDEDGSCQFGNQNGNHSGSAAVPLDPRLAPLGNYGGITLTEALLAGSPALANGEGCTNGVDQRGEIRWKCDIGAWGLSPEEANAGRPSATTGDASAVTASSATLGGRINLQGGAGAYYFLWGTSSAALDRFTPFTSAGVISTDTPVSADLTGLQPGTTYYFQVVAANAAGVTPAENQGSFTTSGTAPPTYLVTTTADNVNDANCTTNSCTLRQAINAANQGPGTDTIGVPAGSYQLSANFGALVVSKGMTITGAGARSTTVLGPSAQRVFDVTSAANPVVIQGFTISGGTATASNGSFGGNVRSSGVLTLLEDTLTNGSAQSGGGVSNNAGTLVIDRSTISGNTALSGGGDSGGVQNFGDASHGGTLTIRNSTITSNTARLGGGVFSWTNAGSPGNTTIVENSTIAFNSATDRGIGGIGGDGTFTFKNTIVSNNTFNGAPSDCSGTITSFGNNLESGSDCGFISSGDLQNADPQLGPLQDNGGQTNTRAPAGTSPALDHVSSGCPPPATDQRGVLRPQGSACDIGAFEGAAAAAQAPSISGQASQSVTDTSATLVANINPNGSATTYVINFGTSASYGQQTPPADVGSGSTAQLVSQAFSGLAPSTTYHFQFVATNAGGTTAGPDTTFTTSAPPPPPTTPPSVAGGTAQSVTDTSATVKADIHPNGSATTYVVKYGTSTDYGQQTPQAALGSPTAEEVASQPLTGLAPSTTYHFQFVATNAGGTTAGPDATFTTGPQLTGTSGSQVSGTLASGNGCPTSATINWGDSSPNDAGTINCQAAAAPTFTVSGSHTYATAGNYTILVSVAGGATYGAGAVITGAPTSLPAVSGQAAQSVTDTGATLLANVNPNGSATTYVIDYGTSAAYGQQTTPTSVGSASTPVLVSQAFSGLASATTYHFRFVATNTGGTTPGPDMSFTTAAPPPGSAPPSIVGEAAQDITQTDATVLATVNPNGSPTSYFVRYGTTTSYGKQTAPIAIGADSTLLVVSGSLTALTPGTTYRYQFVATNGVGTTLGPDTTFTTTAPPPPPPAPQEPGTTSTTTTTTTTPTTTTPAPGAQGPQPPPPPVEGVSVDVLPLSGTVLVNGQPLQAGQQIPLGSIIDATHGTVVLQSFKNGVLQQMQFSGAVFQVFQLPDGTTQLVLQGGDFTICKAFKPPTLPKAKPKPKTAKAKAKKTVRHTSSAVAQTAPVVRALWGNGEGSFQTKGRYAAATVRGTVYYVADRCDGTITHVEQGIVSVHDDVLNKDVTVNAGASYLAKAK